MHDSDGHELGGAGGGLLRIFTAIGTALVAIVVGWSISKRVKLEVRVPIGAGVPGACIGGIVGFLVPTHILPDHDRLQAVVAGIGLGLIAGFMISAVVLWLIEATSKD